MFRQSLTAINLISTYRYTKCYNVMSNASNFIIYNTYMPCNLISMVGEFINFFLIANMDSSEEHGMMELSLKTINKTNHQLQKFPVILYNKDKLVDKRSIKENEDDKDMINDKGRNKVCKQACFGMKTLYKLYDIYSNTQYLPMSYL